MKTHTFATLEHSDDVSDVGAKNTDFEPQNVLFRATDFYSFTAQSMSKDCFNYCSMVLNYQSI